MPVIGETRKRPHGHAKTTDMWLACVGCGIERWTELRGGQPLHLKCNKCATVHFRTYKVKL